MPGSQAATTRRTPVRKAEQRRTAQADTLAEFLFALTVLGDDRTVARTVVARGA